MIPPKKAIRGNQYFLWSRDEKAEQPMANKTEQIANTHSNSLFTNQVPARNGIMTISIGRLMQCTAQRDDMQKPSLSKLNLKFLKILLFELILSILFNQQDWDFPTSFK